MDKEIENKIAYIFERKAASLYRIFIPMLRVLPMNYRNLLIICICFSSCGVAGMQSTTEMNRKEGQIHNSEQTGSLNVLEDGVCIIKDVIDLHGGTSELPSNVLLTFKKGGAIVNGTLIGNKTRISQWHEKILGVRLKGTWCVEQISDINFDNKYLSDDEIISNLNTIQSDEIYNEVSINRDFHVTISKSGGSVLEPSSHSILNLNGTLFLEGNDCKSYQIINIKNKEDVSIKGGRIVGDVGKHTYIKDSSSEWGMGVYILQSKNINISDLYITKCTGDGIYITGGKETSIGAYDNASKNISIMNVTCDDNRRQGLSIIHVDGMAVRNCSFINTGLTEFTAPGAGVDIEPNISNGRNMSVRNIVVDNCTITNNAGVAVSTSCSHEEKGIANHKNILFSNCYTDGKLSANSTDLTFRKCIFAEVRFAGVYTPTHITMENCIISGGNGISLYAPSGHSEKSKNCLLSLDITDCTITVTDNNNTDAKSLISCYKSYVDNLGYVNMRNCHLTIPKKKTKSFKLIDYNFKGKLHISESIIDMEGRDFEATGLSLNNNEIRCKRTTNAFVSKTNKIIYGK